MMTRAELEMILGTKLSDEQWTENQRILGEVADTMWDEDHPMDE